MKAQKHNRLSAEMQAQYKAPKRNLKYDAWFAQQIGRGTLKAHLKETLKIHMKCYGFFDNGEFDKGLDHFGVKKP